MNKQPIVSQQVTSCFRSTGSMPIPKVSAEKAPVMTVNVQPSPPPPTLPAVQEADEVHIHELELSTAEIKGKNQPILPPVMAKVTGIPIILNCTLKMFVFQPLYFFNAKTSSTFHNCLVLAHAKDLRNFFGLSGLYYFWLESLINLLMILDECWGQAGTSQCSGFS